MNFKKKKIKTCGFTGLPPYLRSVVDKIQLLRSLADFIPVELCNLEYLCERGSAIDGHFDDVWLWGERLVTVNLLSHTVYTMTQDAEPHTQVLVFFPRRSLIVMTGPARYEWKHGIQRRHVASLRLGMTLRELTPEFLAGGERERLGKDLIDMSLTFNGTAVGATSASATAASATVASATAASATAAVVTADNGTEH